MMLRIFLFDDSIFLFHKNKVALGEYFWNVKYSWFEILFQYKAILTTSFLLDTVFEDMYLVWYILAKSYGLCVVGI